MRIAVDLDGVCYEFERTARYMLREYRRCKGLERQSSGWDWIKDNVPTDDWRWLWNEGVELGLFRYGHCTTGSVVGLNNLIAHGHDVLAVTHRPTSAVPDTLAWLAYNEVPWTEVHILSNGEPKSTVEADVLVDDKPENILEWRLAGRKAIMYNRPWNWRYGGSYRAYNWREVVDIIDGIQGGLRSKGAGGDRAGVHSVVAKCD